MSAAASRKVIFAALIGNSMIAVTKFVATSFTGSSAMFSEGIHSVVDTGNQALLLYGLKRAQQPPDRRFPFGHGKEVYFWSFVVAILIFALGAGISIYEGLHRIGDPQPIRNPMISYVVLGLAMVFEGVAWTIAFREFRRAKGRWNYLEAVQRGKDPSMFLVLFEDSAAMLGLVVAFAGVLATQVTGLPVFDGIASLVIGAILGGTAIWLAYETKGLLIGESANQHVVDGIRRIAGAADGVEHVNEVLTMHMGPEYILVNLSLRFKRDARTTDLEHTIAQLDDELQRFDPRVKRVFVEAEPRPPAPDA